MTRCPKCGADPLGSGQNWKGRIGSAGMVLAALVTIALIAITTYIMYLRFVRR